MNVKLAYLGRSSLQPTGRSGALLSFAPNLARDAVAFDAPLRHPPPVPRGDLGAS
jgi:hypothetical protein